MNLTKKNYIFKNYLSLLKTNNILFVLKQSYLSPIIKLHNSGKEFQNQIVSKSINNKLFKKIIANSLLENFNFMFTSGLVIIYRKKNYDFNINNILQNKHILGFKINSKFYFSNQLAGIKTLNYRLNMRSYIINIKSASKIFSRLLKRD